MNNYNSSSKQFKIYKGIEKKLDYLEGWLNRQNHPLSMHLHH